jgi:hypothetical protein
MGQGGQGIGDQAGIIGTPAAAKAHRFAGRPEVYARILICLVAICPPAHESGGAIC